ncbi:hypothetical protein K493DRAFT_45896 [Basidiobolus meristosporus CBS 931.73]|uniref:LysM domain-containing protein n=1 Tax=Basidiobolus meristosporus CBS 931.73 TaxID=1314790 RepID=A0A1Y1Y322_9FUNG|nr:hypothetical protein K493DRAFT_45896 [Basidiobolus meristosporus CBS 931.73]|eukprot:ORX92116.1 hypothetical protein K493DRAFT_45896 [Basidiobolus meristosporus CBS 931.73]
MSSNLVNRRQRIIPETTYSTANQWFARGQEEAEPTTTEITEEHNVTPRVAQRFSTAPQPTSIRFFDASSISTIKPTASNVKAIEEAPSPQVDLSEIPRAKAILLHKVQPADTFAGLSLKYGIEVSYEPPCSLLTYLSRTNPICKGWGASACK